MKINSGTVCMDSKHSYTSNTQVTQATTMTQVGTGITQYDSFMNSQTNSANALVSDLYTNLRNNTVTITDAKSALQEFHEKLIKQLEEFMERIKQQLLGIEPQNSIGILDVSTGSQPGTLWTRQDYQSITYTESETTSFQGTGSVVTADGRSIEFNITMEMSRSFTETSEALISQPQYVVTDPLVIQLEDAPTTISDQKWFFDIDNDGIKEEMSGLAKGNGFLALDTNGNGIIDNGSELFGTASGNGFKDLAVHDEDGNGWIDENDAVYSRLKIWTKDASGKDKLMDLQEADIGAIYLGYSGTQFSHKTSDTNEVQAIVRQTGFYLHESTGAAGIVQQIDFATKDTDSVA